MSNQEPFRYGEDHLSPGLALELARGERPGVVSPAAASRIDASAAIVARIAAGPESVYGINTGFGPLCSTRISPAETNKLQDNLLRSHSVGVGEWLPDETVRLMLVLKAHALARGYSGVARSTIGRILWHLEEGVLPVVPSQGSVGASGDLAPLAHLFLPLIGLGQVRVQGRVFNTGAYFQQCGQKPLTLGPKEGLALINGTQFMSAHGVAALESFHNCLDTADVVGAMTLESLLGSVRPFDPDLHRLRPYDGCCYVAHRLTRLLEGSQMVQSHEECGRVQDPYSLRCMPQVHGASRNAWLHLKTIMQIEINSVTDNPVIIDEERTISGGNFHGQPIALPLDYAAFAASELGNISDRRSYLLLLGGFEGLPKLLMRNIGLNSGFMIPQYTSAALTTENKTLCFPASADSIPTSLGQEDHVSMGSISARKLIRILDNLENILAVELLCAAQAFDYRRPLKSSPVLEACHNVVRSRIDHAEEDRVFADDLRHAGGLIRRRELALQARITAEKENIDLPGGYHGLFSLY